MGSTGDLVSNVLGIYFMFLFSWKSTFFLLKSKKEKGKGCGSLMSISMPLDLNIFIRTLFNLLITWSSFNICYITFSAHHRTLEKHFSWKMTFVIPSSVFLVLRFYYWNDTSVDNIANLCRSWAFVKLSMMFLIAWQRRGSLFLSSSFCGHFWRIWYDADALLPRTIYWTGATLYFHQF